MHNYLRMHGLRQTIAAGLMTIGMGVIGGCVDSPTDALNTPPADQLFLSLRFDQHAITVSTVAPYDTVRLTAIALDGTLTPLPEQPAINITSTDSSVRVTRSGNGEVLLTGRAVGQNIAIAATALIGNTKRVDTAFVTVTNVVTPPTIATFSVQPPPGDSAKFASGIFSYPYSRKLPLTVLDDLGQPVDSIDIRYTSSDTIIGKVDRFTGDILPGLPGSVTYGASVTYYGVRYADTVQFLMGPPLFAYVTVDKKLSLGSPLPVRRFSPSSVTISAGGFVGFDPGARGDSLDVVFDDSLHVVESVDFPSGSGNIPKYADRDTLTGFFEYKRFRVFTRPGTYKFHSTVFPDSGTVVVQ